MEQSIFKSYDIRGIYPKELDKKIAALKLASMDVKIDTLTQKQKKYLNSWELGT